MWSWQQKCKQFSSFFISKPEIHNKAWQKDWSGKRTLWNTFSWKLPIITICILQFSTIYFSQSFSYEGASLNRNSWLKLSTGIYGFCKQSTILLARCNANKKSLLSFTWREMEHMQIQRQYTHSYFQQDDFGEEIQRRLYWQKALALIGQRLNIQTKSFIYIHSSIFC